MNLRSLLILFALALLGGFALVNWQAFMAPMQLSLLVGEVRAPLGLIMLIVTGLITALFLVYVVFQQAGVIVEARRYAKELKANRELADKASTPRASQVPALVKGHGPAEPDPRQSTGARP